MNNDMDVFVLDDVLTELIEDDALFDMSDATSSASESSVDRAPPPKKKQKPGRKPVGRQVAKRGVTYYKRKDEITDLQDQVKELQAKLQQAEENAPLARLNAAATMNGMLSAGLERNHLVFAGTESMLSNYKHTMSNASAASPLKTYIHLPLDTKRRAEILSGMRETKLQEAFRFMAERTRFVDLNIKQGQNEHFDFPNGDKALIGFDVVQFRSGHTVRQVYAALQAVTNTQEMFVSEKLGILTVRESDDITDFAYGQSRFLSTIPEGLEVENNTAVFAGYFERTETSPGFAIAAMDYVDQDDLYPNRPQDCGRKEVVGAILLSEVPSETGLVVAMTRWSNVRFRPPTFALSQDMEKAARERFMGWCQLMPGVMQEWLNTRPPAEA